MDIEGYKSHVRRHESAILRRMLASVSVILIFLGIGILVRLYDDDLADILAPILIFVFGMPLMITGFWWTDRTYRSFPELVCRHCGESLARPRSTVIATGNCPHCGRRVLDDTTIGMQ